MLKNTDKARQLYVDFCQELGIKFDTPDTVETPDRVIKTFLELCGNVGEQLKITDQLLPGPDEVRLLQFDKGEMDELIVVKNARFTSICSHHHLPFFGVAHFGYLPEKSIAGLSKFSRVLNFFAAKPQVQEALTEEVVNFLFKSIKPKWIMAVLEAQHTCSMVRGVAQEHMAMVTSKIKRSPEISLFDSQGLKTELLKLVEKR